MTTIAVTGATGQLSRLVVAALLDRGVPPHRGTGDLQRLIGRPSTPVKSTFEQALGAEVLA